MFYKEIPIQPFSCKIEYTDALFFIGSCFSEEIAKKFSYFKFNVISNPFGTLYNPVSIYNALERIIKKKFVTKDDFFLDDDIYKSFDFHSQIADTNLERLIDNTNKIILESHNFLSCAQWIFITYGTSHIYEHKHLKKIVSNCHKIPDSYFNQRLLELQECISYVENTLNIIQAFNKEINIVFTISPVRYMKYGAFLNQVSKSILFLSVYNKIQKNNNVFYFPSYEIFIDELRDYRFYSNDMLHPADIGINYLWEKLKETIISNEAINIMNKVNEILTASHHKVMFYESNSYKKLKNSILEKIENLEKTYPFLNFNKEKQLWK